MSTYGGGHPTRHHTPSAFSTPASTTLFRRLTWEGTVPLEIRVDPNELPANSDRGLECYFMQASRVSYLPLLMPEIKKFLLQVSMWNRPLPSKRRSPEVDAEVGPRTRRRRLSDGRTLINKNVDQRSDHPHRQCHRQPMWPGQMISWVDELMFQPESRAYANLLYCQHHTAGLVPRCYGIVQIPDSKSMFAEFTELPYGDDPWKPFRDDAVPPKALLLEYIPDVDELALHDLSREVVDASMHALVRINESHILHVLRAPDRTYIGPRTLKVFGARSNLFGSLSRCCGVSGQLGFL